jgi:neopullulanase
MKKILLMAIVLIATIHLKAQYAEVYPSNWWVGMKWNKVQLLIKGEYDDFASEKLIINYPGITVLKVNKLDNSKYISADLLIAPTTKPGKVNIELAANGKRHAVEWLLKPRRTGKGTTYAQGLTAADFIYLLMPDRFSNGDNNNDRIEGYLDQSLNRDSIYDRHGGDLQGVMNHLDYLKEMGVTALWMTPVLKNDMPNRTEHGYAITNHYKVDERLGGHAAYVELSNQLHKRGMKLIQDAVYNHVGLYHWFINDKPTKDWLNEWPTYTQTSYKDQSLMDPYASKYDVKKMSDGWFTRQMPDLNQKNPYVANFLIQHALWSVEEFGVDAWRIDTYIYNDLAFMNKCNQALLDEYPKLHLFGETWVHGTAVQAFYTENNLQTGFKSNLPAVTDFQTNFYGISKAVNEPFGWTEGVNRLYQTLAQDFLYKNPMKQVIFLDNHDLTRWYSQVGEDILKHKMGLTWLLTARGIPQMYYGTEIAMAGSTHPNDGFVRLDFPGGWKNDGKNAFTQAGLSATEIEIQNYVKTLANFRKNASAITNGKLMQFAPEDGLYIYFRYDAKQTIMCIMNTSKEEKLVELNRFSERTTGFSKYKNVINGVEAVLESGLQAPAQTVLVLELLK